jgi:hypothetical protein
MSVDKEINVGIKANSSGFGPAMQEAANTVRSSAENMRGSLASMTEEAAKASAGFAAFAAAAAVGGVLKELVTNIVEMGVGFAKASQQTGMAASSLSQYAMIATASDTSFQGVVKGIEMMDRQLLNVQKGTGPAADAFKILGISVTGTNGNLKSNTELLTELTRKFSEMKDGPEKTALAMAIFGRSGADMIPMLNQGAVAMAKLKADSDALGATMGGDLVANTEQYHHTATELATMLKGMELQLGGVMIPLFQHLGQAIATQVLEWQHGFLTISLKVQAMASTISIATSAAGEAFSLVAHGKFKEAEAVMGGVAANVRKEWSDTALAIEDDAELTKRAVAAIMSEAAEAPKQKDDGQGPHVEDAKAEAALLAKMKEQWKETEDSIRESSTQTFQDLSGQEKTYWTNALDDAKLGAAQKAEIQHHIVELDLAEKKRAAGETMADYKEQESALTGTAVEQATARIAIVKDELTFTRGLYSANSSEVLGIERQLATAERALRTAEATEEKQLEAEKKKERDKAAQEEAKQIAASLQKWQSLSRSIGQSFNGAFDSMMRGTQTFGQTFSALTLSLTQDVVKMLTTQGAQWALHEAMKTGLLSSGLAARMGIQTAADTAGKVAKTASAVAQVTSDAGVGAAGAASAVAAIPFVGPSLAPAAAATTFGEIMGFMSTAVASAAGGYDIPAGINPVTQLHAQEMVLPASIANKVRGDSGGGGGTTIIQAMDVKSFHDFLQANHPAVGAAVKKQFRSGALALSPAGTIR